MAHDVFISYSTVDKLVAESVRTALEAKNIQCWIAPRDIPPGVTWVDAIVDAIDACRLFVLISSTNSNNSTQVLSELQRCASRGLSIIPLRIDDTSLSKAVEFYTSRYQWLDAQIPPLEPHLTQLAETAQRLLAQEEVARTKRAAEAAAKEKARLEVEVAQEKARQEAEEARKIKEAEEKARKEAEEEAAVKEKERLEAEVAQEKTKQEAENARKAKEAEERVRKEAEEKAAKEKARLEAEVAQEKARQEAERAKRAQELEERVKKKAEQEAKEKARLQAKEASELAKKQAKKAREEAEVVTQKITKSAWFWAGALLLVVGLTFLIIIPIISMQKYSLDAEGLKAGLGVQLFIGVIPTALGNFFIFRSLLKNYTRKPVWLRVGDASFIIGVILPFVILVIISYSIQGDSLLPIWYMVVPLILAASLSFLIPSIFCLKRGLAQELQPQMIKLTETRGFWVRLALLLTSLVIPIVLVVFISQNPDPEEGQSVGGGMMLAYTPLIFLSVYYFWRGLVKNQLSKRSYFWLAGISLSLAVVLLFVLLGILLSGTPGTALRWDIMLPAVLLVSFPLVIVGIYSFKKGSIALNL
jgi:actin-related protein